MRINSFYTEGTKAVRPELFDKTAEEIACSFVSVGKDNRGGNFVDGISKTQLRRLFDEVKRFEQGLDGSPEKWSEKYPYIRMIKSKACYNICRAKEKSRNKTVYENLLSFIEEGIGLIKDEKDYHVFTSLFEAVYGFYYEKNPKND